MSSTTQFEDLFDIEQRPGAGLGLWTSILEWQLERVHEANLQHRQHHSPNEQERREDAEAEKRLHGEVYFLTLTIRRVLLFHSLLAKHVNDPRLAEALAEFDRAAPEAKTFRDMYEHLDEYLLDSPRKHIKFPWRAAPVLMSRWDSGNVVIAFGDRKLDVTLAAVAAIKLGKASSEIWDEHIEAAKDARPRPPLPTPDDPTPHTLAVTMGVSAIIGGEDESPQQHHGKLLDVTVREATPEEAASYGSSDDAPPG